ncbi:hypothetical protein DES40_1337 [Litorimonas taeanensis]|uniref:Uncharacterized protein n=1 Tax=Litorimonas taeanensis TaxID=568099 RepID=A0A420WLT0_9PROT|nr:hypothetical protein [Litorimonas taeanensis]RKQ72001.1 hypothetical protein DES40_1337 [Litorimonas taeanensis]
MSKRHQKAKQMLQSDGYSDGYNPFDPDYDLSLYEAPKGKKPKGRQKRESHKRAYYDD